MIAAWWVKPLLALALVAGLLLGFTALMSHERGLGFAAGQAQMKSDLDREFKRAQAKALEDEDAKRAATETSHAEDLKRADVRIASGVAARTELERLRARLSRPSAAASAASGAAGPSTDAGALNRELLGECAGRYEAVAGDARRYADQVIGLQGYVRAACLPQGIESGSPPVGVDSRAGFIGLVTQPTTAPPSSNLAGAVLPQGLNHE